LRQAKTWIYVEQDLLTVFLPTFEAKAADSGANLEVLIPGDDKVLCAPQHS